MNARGHGWVLALLLAVPAATVPGLRADAATDGQALAAEIRSARPQDPVQVRGLIRIRDADGRRRQAPFLYRTAVHGGMWEAVYETPGGDGVPAQRVTAVFRDGESPMYLVEEGQSASVNGPRQLKDGEAMVPFAGSDFWLSDLGLCFVHWPKQRIATEVKLRMRKGRACRVLESVNPEAVGNGYARVLSWIDVETNKPILAEAYRADGRLLKEFEIGGVTKVNGVWELKNLEMRNVVEDSRTILEFKYEHKE